MPREILEHVHQDTHRRVKAELFKIAENGTVQIVHKQRLDKYIDMLIK